MQWRGVFVDDVNEIEEEEQPQDDDEAQEEPKGVEERLIKSIMNVGAKLRIEVPMYSGSLNEEYLIDWINDLDKYFEYEGVAEERKVNFSCTRLKGHTTML